MTYGTFVTFTTGSIHPGDDCDPGELVFDDIRGYVVLEVGELVSTRRCVVAHQSHSWQYSVDFKLDRPLLLKVVRVVPTSSRRVCVVMIVEGDLLACLSSTHRRNSTPNPSGHQRGAGV